MYWLALTGEGYYDAEVEGFGGFNGADDVEILKREWLKKKQHKEERDRECVAFFEVGDNGMFLLSWD